jgi:hypothetical protein
MHPKEGAPGKGSHRDLLAALTSGLVGALALATSIYTVVLQRQQVRASVWPRLDGRDESSENDYKTFIVNRGAGSAIIRRFRLLVDKKPMRSWGDFARTLQLHGNMHLFSDVIGVLNPGAEKQLFEADYEATLGLMEFGDRVRSETCFCSSLDECWSWNTSWGGGADGTLE